MGNIFDLFKKISTDAGAKEVLPMSALVVCLGNPGREYEKTRHNAGFMVGDQLAQFFHTGFPRSRFHALCADLTHHDRRFLLMKPQTYMNLSGEAVREAASFYKIATEDIIVVSDDVSLDIGKMRIRRKGSDGGQRGLRSITEQLGSGNFPRVRVGVGQKPNPEYDLADWVLGKIPDDQWKVFCETTEKACRAVLDILDGRIDAAMNQYN